LPRPIDTLDQLIDDGACRKRHQTHRRDECDLVAEGRRLPHRQGNARRIYNRRITDILDVAECNALFLAAVSDQQRVAIIPNFVNEIEYRLLQEKIAEHGHHYRYDQKQKLPRGLSTARSQWNRDEQDQETKPDNRDDALVEERHLRRNSPHDVFAGYSAAVCPAAALPKRRSI
jgi:hypothetical protein